MMMINNNNINNKINNDCTQILFIQINLVDESLYQDC